MIRMRLLLFIAAAAAGAALLLLRGDPVAVPETPTVGEKPADDAPLDFISMQDGARHEGVTNPGRAPSITGDEDIDAYIRAKAEERGYRLRPAADESRLVAYGNQRLQPEAKRALESLSAAAQEEGLPIVFASGYRSVDRQREIFASKLGAYEQDALLAGEYDATLDAILAVSSVPGYSKHHTGYAADLGCGSYELEDAFRETSCYAWLAKDDFAVARSFGFVPSYPDDGGRQGPDPEPWEFIWIPGLAAE